MFLPCHLKDCQTQTHLDDAKWSKIVDYIADLHADEVDLKCAVISDRAFPLSEAEKRLIMHHLKQLMPSRKWPYHLFGIHVYCEWRSDFKWNRVLHHLAPLKNRTILEVGCGIGNHMWRMVCECAKMVVGIDTTDLFLCQFDAVRKLLNNDRQASLIPVGIEQMQPLSAFETVFSMKVLYDRKSRLDHLSQLKNQAVKGGEFVLETLVVDCDLNTVLIPADRYAKMKNVYFIHSVNVLINWLEKVGFNNVRYVDVATTTLEERRKTDWLENEILIDFLEPNDHGKIIEAYQSQNSALTLANFLNRELFPFYFTCVSYLQRIIL